MVISSKFNPLDPGYQQDPYSYYPKLREQPAIWVEELGNWWVGRYRDVKAISSQTDKFSNAKFHEIALGEFDYAPGAQNLVASDPPDHTRLRNLISPGFKPARIRAMEDRVSGIIEQQLDGVLSRPDRCFDFQKDFAELVPVSVVIELLGADPARLEDFQRWSTDIMSASNRASMNAEQLATVRRAVDEAREYFLNLIVEHRDDPGDDLISLLVSAQKEGSDVTDEEILSFSILLLNGGQETTAHLIGNTMVALWQNPGQLELLRSEPHRMSDAIDESLRYDPPVQTVFLWTTQDVSIDSIDIPKDSPIIGAWGAANRDEDQFENPDTFDITRKKVQHLAFGNGPHFCLGNMLAKMEASIVLRRVFETMPNLHRAEDGPVDWIPSYWIRGPRTLPVTF